MKFYLDCEFTGLSKNANLISLALVSENDDIFYAEFLDYHPDSLNEWIIENVINNLKYVKLSDVYGFWNSKDYMYYEVVNETSKRIEVIGGRYKIAEKLKQWLSKFNTIEIVADVGHYDFVFFADLFGGAMMLPSNICPAYIELNDLIRKKLNLTQREAFDYSRSDLLIRLGGMLPGSQHNALSDAIIAKETHIRLTEYK